MNRQVKLETRVVDAILDETQTPVARMRLCSQGINLNNRLFKPEQVLCDKGCLACGNCVDACPVVREKNGFVFVQNQRTSMALEFLVGEECRRCYRCILACPQVTKSVKEHAAAFRRGEKVVHFLMAAWVVLLAGSGIAMTHYTNFLPALEVGILRWAHRIIGLLLFCLPVLYFMLDKRHMVRFFKKIFLWNHADLEWVRALMRHIGDSKKHPMPLRVQFNPAQKAWYLYIIFIVFPFLGVSGIIQWLGLDYGVVKLAWLIPFMWIHMIFALVTDLLLFIHVYIKYIRNWAILCYDIYKAYRTKRHLNISMLYHS